MIKGLGSTTLARNRLHGDPDAELLRAELFSIDQLRRHAAKLAGQQKVDPRAGPDKLLPRLADNERVLLAAYHCVRVAAQPV